MTMQTPPLPTPSVVVVPVKSAWWSKINWTALIGPTLSLLLVLFAQLPPETKIFGVISIQSIQSIITVIFKTFYTGTITPGSIDRVPPGTG